MSSDEMLLTIQELNEKHENGELTDSDIDYLFEVINLLIFQKA